MVKTNPKVTVMVANYNTSRYLRDCLNSLLDQTYPDFEVLMIDDGSTDDSSDICEHYVQRDPRFRLLKLEHNYGLTYVRHIALPQARGELIAILDADDIASPQRLEAQVAYLEKNPETVLLGSYYGIIDAAGKIKRKKKKVPCSDTEIRWWLTFGNCLIHSTIMYRKKQALECGGYDPAILRGEDIELHSKIIAHGKAEAIPRVLACWRTHQKSMTKDLAQEELEKYYLRVVQHAIGLHTHQTVDDDVASSLFYNTKRPAKNISIFKRSMAVLLKTFHTYESRGDGVDRRRLAKCFLKHLNKMKKRNSKETWWKEGEIIWNRTFHHLLKTSKPGVLTHSSLVLPRVRYSILDFLSSLRRPTGRNGSP
jgi:glycosyltransferase involved in cell wall biosynthesis